MISPLRFPQQRHCHYLKLGRPPHIPHLELHFRSSSTIFRILSCLLSINLPSHCSIPLLNSFIQFGRMIIITLPLSSSTKLHFKDPFGMLNRNAVLYGQPLNSNLSTSFVSPFNVLDLTRTKFILKMGRRFSPTCSTLHTTCTSETSHDFEDHVLFIEMDLMQFKFLSFSHFKWLQCKLSRSTLIFHYFMRDWKASHFHLFSYKTHFPSTVTAIITIAYFLPSIFYSPSQSLPLFVFGDPIHGYIWERMQMVRFLVS